MELLILAPQKDLTACLGVEIFSFFIKAQCVLTKSKLETEFKSQLERCRLVVLT